jgi:hypothetical protein
MATSYRLVLFLHRRLLLFGLTLKIVGNLTVERGNGNAIAVTTLSTRYYCATRVTQALRMDYIIPSTNHLAIRPKQGRQHSRPGRQICLRWQTARSRQEARSDTV